MIRKAVIPVAGLGTRVGAWASGVPKAMLPLLDAESHVRPVLYYLLREAAAAGTGHIGLVISPWQETAFRRYLSAAEAELPDGLAGQVDLIYQPRPLGFGDAVARAAEFVAGEPFLLLLGDHLHVPPAGRPACTAEVAAAFARRGGAAMLGVQVVGPESLPLVGAARGEPLDENLYRCADLIEKPTPEEAGRRLVSPGLPTGRFLAHCGIYVFDSDIFACLQELADDRGPSAREIGLSEAEALLLRRRAGVCFLWRIAGETFDVGSPAGYRRALDAFREVRSP